MKLLFTKINPATPPTTKIWARIELGRLTTTLNLPSTILKLKEGKTTIQRIKHAERICIEKQYFGALFPNQLREVTAQPLAL